MAEAMTDTVSCEHCNNQDDLQDWEPNSVRKCVHGEKNRIKEAERTTMNESNIDGIPCAFCKVEVSIYDLESHMTKCTQSDKRPVKRLKKYIVEEPMNELIPCEYCDTQVSAHELVWHTRQCADAHKRPISYSENESVLIPCEYCNVQVNAHEWEWHTNECVENERRQTENLFKQTANDPLNDLIPCEYCDKSFSIFQFEDHQSICRREQISSTFQPYAPHNQVSGTIFPLPSNWDLSSLNNLSCHVLGAETEEYKFVADKFHQTLPSNTIIRIERIQNRRWYRQYDAHKDDFIERYGDSTEQWLFHGCRKAESAKAIIRDCFNRSHAVNCAVGQGIYFATQALISHGYTQPKKKLRHMFMARVLVGRTTTGDATTRICPPGFDTTGGKNVFVTYHDAQAYGEYLIAYK